MQGKNIIIGITSSIAAYKVLDIVKELKKKHNVYVMMTENASKLVDYKEFEKASGNEVSIKLFKDNVDFKSYLKKDEEMKHISVADSADLFLICPATANFIGKIANGIADDLLTTSIMATNAPVLICPAMNVKMWTNAILQQNVKKLKRLRYEFVDPEKGILACGYEGVGRLANIQKIIKNIERIIERRIDLKGKRILITAGATSEEIDPVRVITNKSSGKMGVSLAEEAYLRGAEVTLIRGHNSVNPIYNFKDIIIGNVKELFNKIKENLDNDIMIHSAAVSDFSVNKTNEKIKSGENLHLELEPTTKIFENIKKLNKNIKLVGFKAEFKLKKEELIDRAYKLLKNASADFIVANDVGKENTGFDVETNEVYIINNKKEIEFIELNDKKIIANKILDKLK